MVDTEYVGRFELFAMCEEGPIVLRDEVKQKHNGDLHECNYAGVITALSLPSNPSDGAYVDRLLMLGPLI